MAPRRRAFLASLAGVAAAGCLGGNDAADTPTTTATGTPSSGTPTDSTPRASSSGTPTDSTPRAPSSLDTEWPMPGAAPGSSNGTTAAGPTGTVQELWAEDVGEAVSAPVVADGTLYAGTAAGDLLAFDARSGERRRTLSIGERAGTPRVLDAVVYVPTAAGIVALDTTGEERWRERTPDRVDGPAHANEAADDGVLLAAHGVYWLAEHEDGATVVALERADGSERWRTDIEAPWRDRMFASDDSVYVASGTAARTPWKLGLDGGHVQRAPGGSGADFPSARLYRAGTRYETEPFFGQAIAIPAADGGNDWSTDVPGGDHVMAAGSELVAVGVSSGEVSGGGATGLHAFAADDGEDLWDASIVPAARPVVAEEAVVVLDDDGSFRAFDPADGAELWTNAAMGAEAFVVVDDVLYATGGSEIRAFRES